MLSPNVLTQVVFAHSLVWAVRACNHFVLEALFGDVTVQALSPPIAAPATHARVVARTLLGLRRARRAPCTCTHNVPVKSAVRASETGGPKETRQCSLKQNNLLRKN